MSLESVVEDIREQAHAEAEEIRQTAAEEAESIVAEAEAEAETILAEREREVEREAEQLREQQLSSANLEAKQLKLQARREALDTVREQVESRLAELPTDERRALTEVLLEAALEEFDADEELVLHGPAGDEDILADLAAADDRLSVGEPVDRLGGVIVEGTTTRMRVDNSLDAVLDEVWDDSLRSISDALFEG